jgi:transcriptional regulator with GAF, ATPase, and Fis domain
MDEHKFCHEAGSRICSSLMIEKAFFRCFLYIRDFIPADSLTLHLFDPGLGFIETVVGADIEGSDILSHKTQLEPAIREQIQTLIEHLGGTPQCQILERLSLDTMAGVVARDYSVSDHPALVLDLIIENKYLGIIVVYNTRGKKYTRVHADKMLLLHGPFSMACANFLRHRDLMELKERLADNYRHLQDDLICLKGDEIVGAEQGLKRVMEMVRQVAPADSPVLLLGETGVGKDVIAQAIHRLSSRRDNPLIKVDCTVIPDNLVESDLFGHEKGAFTGAISRIHGRFERAHGGTVFLDEIGELSFQSQKKILRVLQEGVIERVGGTETIRLDIRIIAATNRSLETMVAEGVFRQDLFFRLNVFPIVIPPLRVRREDIPLFVYHFIKKMSRKLRLPAIANLAPGAIDILTAYPWPGNIRELKNLVERELIISGGKPLTFTSLSPLNLGSAAMPVEQMEAGSLSLDRAMSAHIQEVIAMTEGRVEGPLGAARLLDIHPRTLQHRMKKLCITFNRK